LAEWFLRIPPEIQARAYRAGNEFAWVREDAVRAIEAVKRHFVVIGVEVWLPTTPGPTIPSPFIYHWAWESDGTTSAVDFIRDFAWDEADVAHREREPYFNLTMASLNA
jgi:hypothetical protein